MPTVSGNVSFSRLERLYLKLQSDFDTGASFGNNDYVRHIKATLEDQNAVLTRKDKTGHRTTSQGVRGRGYGKWTFNSSLVTSGTTNTAPPAHPILVSAFCQAPAGGVYSLTDTNGSPPPQIPVFSMGSYRTPSTLNQRIAVGCTTNEITWKIGEDIAEFEANGESKLVLDSNYYSSATAEETSGYGSFPAEPGSPVATDGGIIAGFTGSITVGGSSIARVRTATIKMANNAEVVKDTFGFYRPVDNEGDARVVTVTFSMYDSDEASQNAVRVASKTKTPVDGNFTVGTVTGNKVQIVLKSIQLADYTMDDSGRRFSVTVPESRAFGSSVTALDEITVSYL